MRSCFAFLAALLSAGHAWALTKAQTAALFAGPPIPQLIGSYTQANCGVGPQNTCSITPGSPLQAGDTAIFGVYEYNGGSSQTVIQSIVGTGIANCRELSGTSVYDAGNGGLDLWACNITEGGTPLITATWASNAQFQILYEQDIRGLSSSPDLGIGNNGNSVSNVSSFSVNTTGPNSKSNAFGIALAATNNATPGSGWTALTTVSSSGTFLEYRIVQPGPVTISAGGDGTTSIQVGGAVLR